MSVEHYPRCPHCGYLDKAFYGSQDEIVYDGDTYEDVECGECGLLYDIDAVVTFSFYAKKRELDAN